VSYVPIPSRFRRVNCAARSAGACGGCGAGLVDDGADGVDDGFWGLIGDAVIAVGDHDLAALRGKMSEGGLKLEYPCFVELVDLLGSDGIIVGLPVLECGENDDGHVADIGNAAGGIVDFRIAATTMRQDCAISGGGTSHCSVGFRIFYALVAESLCDGLGVSDELRWHVDGLVAHEKANETEARGNGSTPTEELANEDGHAIDRCKHNRRFILIGITGIDEDETSDFGWESTGVNAGEASADGMADKNVGGRDGSTLKELVEVVGDCGACARNGGGSLQPSPARSYQQTRANLATSGRTFM